MRRPALLRRLAAVWIGAGLIAPAPFGALHAQSSPGRGFAADAQHAPSARKDPDHPTKAFHVGFARVESDCPFPRADLMKITPHHIAGPSQEEVGRIDGRLTAGPIPDGLYGGDLFCVRGGTVGDRQHAMKPRPDEIGVDPGRADADAMWLANFTLYHPAVGEAGAAGFASGSPPAQHCCTAEQAPGASLR